MVMIGMKKKIKIRTVMKEDIQKMNPEDIKGKMSSSLLSKVNEFESEEV